MKRPEYGVDAPGVVLNFALLGGFLLLLALFLPRGFNKTSAIMGAVFLGEGLAMLLYSYLGKFRHRDRLLAMAELRGDEKVLDVGTGRGLLLIGAAKLLTSGRAVGIDIWSAQDLSGNSAERAEQNIMLEGVADRAEIRTEDARSMSFPNASFDVVLSNLALHNIPDAEGRAAACAEIARVLRPSGTALISDFEKTGEYVAAFKDAGLVVERTWPYCLDVFPPLRVVKASKNLLTGET